MKHKYLTVEDMLKRYSFFSVEDKNVILVYGSEHVGEFETEHIAVVLLFEPDTKELYLTTIDYDDKEFKKLVEDGDIKPISKISMLYAKMKIFLMNRHPNYSTVLLTCGQKVGTI
jgi:hypothetical protein